MQTVTATTSGRRRARLALGVLTATVSVLVAGCSLIPGASPSAGSDTETPDAAAGFVYTDEAAGFAITFPAEPTVEAVPDDANGAQRASYSTTPDPTAPDGVYYIAGGTTQSDNEYTPQTLEDNVFGLVHLAAPTYLPTPETTELDGLPAVTADFVWSDGKNSTIIMAGEGHTFYQLLVIGGTPEEHDKFLSTFELLG
jgi:hypothetical protein